MVLLFKCPGPENRLLETLLLLSQKIGAEVPVGGEEKEKPEQVEEADGEEVSSEVERLRLRTILRN